MRLSDVKNRVVYVTRSFALPFRFRNVPQHDCNCLHKIVDLFEIITGLTNHNDDLSQKTKTCIIY